MLLKMDQPIGEGVAKILSEAGISKKKSLSELLEENRLTPQDVLRELGDLAGNAGNDAIRLRAIETALKLNPETREALNDNSKIAFAPITIIINDPAAPVGINPILIPRKVA